MFKCAVTKKLSKLGEKPFKVVTEKRARVYTRKYWDDNRNLVEEVCGRGWEIVKEVLMTKEGYDLWLSKNPDGATLIK